MNGIAICWPPNSRRIRTIAKSRRIPLHCHPRQATVPGSQIALVVPDGEIQLLCTIERIDGPCVVRTAAGDHRIAGYELVARKGTLQTNEDHSLAKLAFRWRWIGQLRYFDQRKFRPVTITDERDSGPFLLEVLARNREQGVRFRDFGDVSGMQLDDPEARLVRRYVKWIDSQEHFQQTQRLSDGCWMDLFNTTKWTLFEAKFRSDDITIRGAFGQLYDYRRSFARSPGLAILVATRPRRRLLQFLSHFNVAAVWEQPSGAFADTVAGKLTSVLRSEYRERTRRKRDNE